MPGARSNHNLFVEKPTHKMTLEEEQERNEYIGEKYNTVFDQMMKKTKSHLIHDLGINNQVVLNREMEEAVKRNKFDVAW